MPSNENTKTQIKSRQRAADHGEVFTNPREVNAMLDLVRDESYRLDSRFLEPACGDGNFLIEILRRKLSLLSSIKSQTEWEFQSLIAVGSCYGIELLEDNAEACRQRLYGEVVSQHPAQIGKQLPYTTSERLNLNNPTQTTKERSVGLSVHPTSERLNLNNPTQTKKECSVGLSVAQEMRLEETRPQNPYVESLRYMLQKNIVCGDALTYRTADGHPITFSEWTPIAGSMQFSRRDFQFDFLVNQTHQYSLLDEQGEAQSFDEPVRSYPPKHYTQLYRYEEQGSHSI